MVWLVADLVHREGRVGAGRRIGVLVGAAALAGVLAVPLLRGGGPSTAAIGSWPRDFGVQGFTDAAKLTFGMPYLGFLDPTWLHNQTLLAVLALVGAAVLGLTRRGFGLVAAWLVWSSVLFVYLLGVSVPVLRTVTGIFYNSYVRISGVLGPLQWLLCGVAVAGAAVLLGRAAQAAGGAGPPDAGAAGVAALGSGCRSRPGGGPRRHHRRLPQHQRGLAGAALR